MKILWQFESEDIAKVRAFFDGHAIVHADVESDWPELVDKLLPNVRHEHPQSTSNFRRQVKERGNVLPWYDQRMSFGNWKGVCNTSPSVFSRQTCDSDGLQNGHSSFIITETKGL